jgi:hypothetical protein
MSRGRTVMPMVLAVLVVLLMLSAVPVSRPAPSSASERPLGPAIIVPSAAVSPAHAIRSVSTPAALSPAPHSVRAVPAGPQKSSDATPAGGPRGWSSSDFFTDVAVDFSGPGGQGLSGPFQTEPFENTVPLTTLGFWMNLTALAPIVSANLNIWSTQWSSTGATIATSGFSPTSPRLVPLLVNQTDPARASFFFNDYRFFWPGSTVWFNATVTGFNSTPSIVNSAANDSVPVPYPGGFVNNATWSFTVASPWASTNFSNDIAIATTPSVLGSPSYEPNPNQTLAVEIRAIDLGGTLTPIPRAALSYQVYLNGSITTFSEPFGPVNQTSMALLQSIGPYRGGTISFNVSAWLPWEGGIIDRIISPQFSFSWSNAGGWWHPLQGLTANLALAIAPSIPTSQPGVAVPILPTAAPVNVTLHEPIENVTISSSQVDFTFRDNGLSHSGSLIMNRLSANTTSAVLPGLPPGAEMTFYLVAKDIYGNPVSSGNYSYEEAGPTAPPLPSGQGLVFVEVLDLSGGGLISGFGYTLSNTTWSVSGAANVDGFAIPLLPGSSTPVDLAFGSYFLTVHAFGGNQSATVVLSPSSPTPTVVFYGESYPLPILTTGFLPVDSIAGALGLLAAAIITLPLVRWYEERRARLEEEQRRVTF